MCWRRRSIEPSAAIRVRRHLRGVSSTRAVPETARMFTRNSAKWAKVAQTRIGGNKHTFHVVAMAAN